ncbi:MAG TPA: DNA methyltransferase [Anaerolineae bacterium]|nr:DNA methyltransferase [Anaerolineae bacterium]
MPFLSPLRYPGGKRKLANYIKLVFESNNLLDGNYIEPYAGGASIALALLFEEYVGNIWINDLDRSVFAFWNCVLNDTEVLCRLIQDTPVNIDEWHRQKHVQADLDASLVQLGFSTFFLNRTNRSGILSGGVIGGKDQTGKWKIDARYNKSDLIGRIEKIARHRNRIHLHNQDALVFVRSVAPNLPERTLFYLDPPYFVKGQQLLYKSYYREEDHWAVAQMVRNLPLRWIVSYDDTPEIRALYQEFRSIEYSISYSAQDRYRGAEKMFFSDNLIINDIHDPAMIRILSRRGTQ